MNDRGGALSGTLTLDPALTAVWVLLGGLFVVLLLARVAPPDGGHPIGAVTAFRHATVMAVAMGVSVFLVLLFEVPHGYWVPMTAALSCSRSAPRRPHWRGSGSRARSEEACSPWGWPWCSRPVSSRSQWCR